MPPFDSAVYIVALVILVDTALLFFNTAVLAFFTYRAIDLMRGIVMRPEKRVSLNGACVVFMSGLVWTVSASPLTWFDILLSLAMFSGLTCGSLVAFRFFRRFRW